MAWFLYEGNTGAKWVNSVLESLLLTLKSKLRLKSIKTNRLKNESQKIQYKANYTWGLKNQNHLNQLRQLKQSVYFNNQAFVAQL